MSIYQYLYDRDERYWLGLALYPSDEIAPEYQSRTIPVPVRETPLEQESPSSLNVEYISLSGICEVGIFAYLPRSIPDGRIEIDRGNSDDRRIQIPKVENPFKNCGNCKYHNPDRSEWSVRCAVHPCGPLAEAGGEECPDFSYRTLPNPPLPSPSLPSNPSLAFQVERVRIETIAFSLELGDSFRRANEAIAKLSLDLAAIVCQMSKSVPPAWCETAPLPENPSDPSPSSVSESEA